MTEADWDVCVDICLRGVDILTLYSAWKYEREYKSSIILKCCLPRKDVENMWNMDRISVRIKDGIMFKGRSFVICLFYGVTK